MPYARKVSSSNYNNSRFMNEDCQLAAAFDTFSGRWTSQVLFCIHFGLNRFSLIKAHLPRISDQILGLRLNHLIEHRLIIKTENSAEKTYSLSKKGRELISIFEQMVIW